MKMIRYRKPSWKPTSENPRGVHSGKMKVFFKDGKVPYKEGQSVMVRLKKKETPAFILKVNECSITVKAVGYVEKKVIPFQNVIKKI